jgi:hypothetical protein
MYVFRFHNSLLIVYTVIISVRLDPPVLPYFVILVTYTWHMTGYSFQFSLRYCMF